jgi:CheY-like chemotaxis protein
MLHLQTKGRSMSRASTVLVVDDDHFILQMIETMLRMWGYDVVTAINGRHGLDLFREVRPELLITDINMPVMNGAELVEALRRGEQLVKIIAMSVTIERTPWGFRRAVPLAGADATVGKPFYPAELRAAINRVFASSVDETVARAS